MKKRHKKGLKAKKKKPTVKGKLKESHFSFRFFVLVCVLLAGLGIFILVQQNYSVTNDLKIREMEEKIEAQKGKQKELRISLARLKSPARITRIARDELGLDDPGQVVYVMYTRDAGGNMVCQSCLEKRVKPPSPAKQEEKTSASAQEDSTSTLSQR
ncbi:MAG: septum formation initiator family protein [Actinobacteria bacterium]|nr:septum formation initiator family protein [Actinomycetota bacterium]